MVDAGALSPKPLIDSIMAKEIDLIIYKPKGGAIFDAEDLSNQFHPLVSDALQLFYQDYMKIGEFLIVVPKRESDE